MGFMSKVDDPWWQAVLGGPINKVPDLATDTKYVAFPNTVEPRVLVDAGCRTAVSEVLERAFMNRGFDPTIARTLAGVAPRLTAKRRDGWFLNESRGLSLREFLSQLLGEDVHLSISVGPPRPNRKPVVRIYSNNELFAVAKIGPNPHTAAMVNNESRWLAELGGVSSGGVSTPGFLGCSTFSGMPIVVMEALPLDGSPSVEIASIPHDALRQLLGDDTWSFDTSAWWEAIRDRVNDVADQELTHRASLLESEAGNAGLTYKRWHGDWSPWNVGRSVTGGWCIWDWERACDGAPLGFDQLHLHETYGGAGAASEALAVAGVAAQHRELTAHLYYLERDLRIVEAKQSSSQLVG